MKAIIPEQFNVIETHVEVYMIENLAAIPGHADFRSTAPGLIPCFPFVHRKDERDELIVVVRVRQDVAPITAHCREFETSTQFRHSANPRQEAGSLRPRLGNKREVS